MPMQTACLRNTCQNVKGRHCGESRGLSHYRKMDIEITLTCVTNSCRGKHLYMVERKSKGQSIREHAVRLSSLTLIHITKDFWTVNDVTE